MVDNHPSSRTSTPPVVAEFPEIRLIAEPRQGLSYARNAGIAASTGDIIATTDDDVAAPADWIAMLVAPFADPAVMVVTGNVIPARACRPAHSVCSKRMAGSDADRSAADVGGHDWFWSFRGPVPTWRLGATANAAFRAAIFADPGIGLMDEALGAGMPTGCSEDTYVFYRVLRAGHAIVYEPDAFVWHHHRADMRALRRQIYAYSERARGLSAYARCCEMATGGRSSGCWYSCPTCMRRGSARWITRADDYPLRLSRLEIAGTLAGPWRCGGRAAASAATGAARPTRGRAIASRSRT